MKKRSTDAKLIVCKITHLADFSPMCIRINMVKTVIGSMIIVDYRRSQPSECTPVLPWVGAPVHEEHWSTDQSFRGK